MSNMIIVETPIKFVGFKKLHKKIIRDSPFEHYNPEFFGLAEFNIRYNEGLLYIYTVEIGDFKFFRYKSRNKYRLSVFRFLGFCKVILYSE